MKYDFNQPQIKDLKAPRNKEKKKSEAGVYLTCKCQQTKHPHTNRGLKLMVWQGSKFSAPQLAYQPNRGLKNA